MRERIQPAIHRVEQTLPFRVLTAFGDSQAGNFAAALAFSGFLAMFPMILGALSIIGLAIRDPATEAHFQTLMVQIFPSSAQPELQKALHGVRQSAGWMGLVSIVGLVWSASGIFGSMEFALTEIFGTKQRDMLRQKLMGFSMMLLLVVAIVVTLGVNALAALAANAAGSVPALAWALSFFVGAIVMVGLLLILYRFVPNRTFALRQVMPGALLAGILIEVLSLAWPIYARLAGGFNTYGAQFGLFFILATWLYLLSELLLLGAVYNRFRMGEPFKKGLIASPLAESHESKRPVDAIKDKKGEPRRTREKSSDGAPARARATPRSAFQRAALGLVLAVAVAGGVVRRRGRGKLAG
ncbi:MAG TPA: YihY/virulence factor BrkB family protein [Candidatus Dormibacteraeota bacterium]|jgi:membrane protein